MQVRAMRGRTDFDVRFVFWLIPLWINFRSLLFTCWLILPLIFWPPSFSGTGNESQKNTCNISLKFGVFCNILMQRGWWRTGWYHIAEKNAWKIQARSQEACLKVLYKKHSYTKKNFLIKQTSSHGNWYWYCSQARAWDLLRVACSQIRCRPN